MGLVQLDTAKAVDAVRNTWDAILGGVKPKRAHEILGRSHSVSSGAGATLVTGSATSSAKDSVRIITTITKKKKKLKPKDDNPMSWVNDMVGSLGL